MDLFLYEKELPFDTRTTGSFAIFTRSVCFESAIPGEAGGWAELGEWNEEADSYAVRFAVRGCKEEDIKVEEKGGLLKLLAKRVEVVERVVRYGKYRQNRTMEVSGEFYLPKNANPNSVKVTLQNDILTIVCNKERATGDAKDMADGSVKWSSGEIRETMGW